MTKAGKFEVSMANNETIAENVPKVYEAGKKAEYDAFWDVFQLNGTRANYEYSFASRCWNEKNLKPKYPMTPTGAQRMFQNSDYRGDLRVSASIDFSKSTSLQYLFH